MKSNNILEILKGKNITIPYILIKNMDELKISYKEMIFLSYLMMYGDKILFDAPLFSKDLFISLQDVIELIGELSNKRLLEMTVIKNDKGMVTEYIDINLLYLKLLGMTLKEDDALTLIKDEKEDTSNIYKVIEHEFGRTISPIECETIKGWLDANMSVSLIKEALKEAVLNGVTNLKYMDKILYEWNRKGYTKKDVKDKERKKQKEENIKLFDYDWLEDNE